MQRTVDQLAVIVRDWALKKPEIERIWFFGSRVKGSHKPTSDLDIAIELTAQALATDIYRNGRNVWLSLGENWGGELDRLTGLDTDPYEYHAGAPYVLAGVAESRLLVFER